MTCNIIADIAGQYDCLLRLLAKMPKADRIVLVGDLNDRGPKSNDVIKWAMSEPNVHAVDSNHGHMFVDWWNAMTYDDYRFQYDPEDFFNNGGYETLRSYQPPGSAPVTQMQAANRIPSTHIRWLDELPWKYEQPGLIVTHAAMSPYWDSAPPRFHRIWNRAWPHAIKDTFQVFGHNASKHVRWYTEIEPAVVDEEEINPSGEGELFAACIDTSHAKKLTGMHWPTKQIFQEAYEVAL